MELTEVGRILDALDDAGVRCWLEGGWGVDALAGRQTRPHRDLDLDVIAAHEATALAALATLGYAVETDERPTRVELVAPGRGWVDLHPVVVGEDGRVRQARPDGGWWVFPPDCVTSGRIDDRVVSCVTLEAQRLFHEGYPLRDVDRLDLAVLDGLS